MTQKTYSVYIHTTPSNKKYIGITTMEPKLRWLGGAGYAHNSYFKNAVKKYGWANIQHEILFNDLDENSALEIERELIAKYKTTNRKCGYNLTSGGEKGKTHSKESKLKMSMNRKGKNVGEDNHNFGKKFSEETRLKLSIAKKGQRNSLGMKRTEEQKRKMSIAQKGLRVGEQNYMFGKTHTPEARKKISENRAYVRGYEHPSAKRVIQYNLNGDVVQIWGSCSEAIENFRSTLSSGIKACCQGRCKTAYGYIWKYGKVN